MERQSFCSQSFKLEKYQKADPLATCAVKWSRIVYFLALCIESWKLQSLEKRPKCDTVESSHDLEYIETLLIFVWGQKI
jgi:hypothetical protein